MELGFNLGSSAKTESGFGYLLVREEKSLELQHLVDLHQANHYQIALLQNQIRLLRLTQKSAIRLPSLHRVSLLLHSHPSPDSKEKLSDPSH